MNSILCRGAWRRSRYSQARLSGAEGPHPSGTAEPPEPRAADAHQRARMPSRRSATLIVEMIGKRDADDAAQPGRARDPRRRRTERAVRPRPARGAAPRSGHLRHPREPFRSGLHRAKRPARGDRRRVQGRPSSAADHRAHRQLGRPADRRIEPDGGRAAQGRIARQRDHPAARARRSCPVDSPIPHHPARGAGPRGTRDAQPADARLSAAPRSPAASTSSCRGAPGAGKTTLLNVLSGFISECWSAS